MNIKTNSHLKIHKRIAYHQAGHSASIYLGNKQKQLPAVHFQIIIKLQERDPQQSDRYRLTAGKYAAKLEGGRLFQSLPISFAEAARYFSNDQQERFRCAFEADIINLLAGPLAEAKYVALCDGETFNANLVNLNALHFYGGSSDIEVINEYMACLSPHTHEREEKLAELFWAAFSFVNEAESWQKITALAESIRYQPVGVIPCEDITSLLDSDVTSQVKADRPTNNRNLQL